MTVTEQDTMNQIWKATKEIKNIDIEWVNIVDQ